MGVVAEAHADTQHWQWQMLDPQSDDDNNARHLVRPLILYVPDVSM